MPSVDPRTAPTLRFTRGNPSLRQPRSELTDRVARIIKSAQSLDRLPSDVADRIIGHLVLELRTRPILELDLRLAEAIEAAWAFETMEDDEAERCECAPEQAQRGQIGGAA